MSASASPALGTVCVLITYQNDVDSIRFGVHAIKKAVALDVISERRLGLIFI